MPSSPAGRDAYRYKPSHLANLRWPQPRHMFPFGMENVVVLGATPKQDRYAFRAMNLLKQKGHHAIPVNPAFPEVLGERCYPRVGDVPEEIDTISFYLGPARSTPLIDEILAVKPKRLIFNPGAENPALEAKARHAGIDVVNGCTLVMLASGTF